MAALPSKPPAACPKCKGEKTSLIGTASTNPPLQLLRCSGCGHIFTGGGPGAPN